MLLSVSLTISMQRESTETDRNNSKPRPIQLLRLGLPCMYHTTYACLRYPHKYQVNFAQSNGKQIRGHTLGKFPKAHVFIKSSITSKLTPSSLALPAPRMGHFHHGQEHSHQCHEEPHHHRDDPVQGQDLRLGTFHPQKVLKQAPFLTHPRMS